MDIYIHPALPLAAAACFTLLTLLNTFSKEKRYVNHGILLVLLCVILSAGVYLGESQTRGVCFTREDLTVGTPYLRVGISLPDESTYVTPFVPQAADVTRRPFCLVTREKVSSREFYLGEDGKLHALSAQREARHED